MKSWNKKKKPKNYSKIKWRKGIYHNFCIVVDMYNKEQCEILTKNCIYEPLKEE